MRRFLPSKEVEVHLALLVPCMMALLTVWAFCSGFLPFFMQVQTVLCRMTATADTADFSTSTSCLVVPKELASVAPKWFRSVGLCGVGSPGLQVDTWWNWSSEGGEDRSGSVAPLGFAAYRFGDVRKVEDGL